MPSKTVAHFGVIGLTDASKNILLEMHELGYIGCVYDFSQDDMKAFLENEAKDTKIIGTESLEKMINSLTTPRCIVMFSEEMMIQDFIDVGLTIDDFIDMELLPYMSYQDYFFDASSSGREESKERVKDLMEKGIRYAGMKEGARVAFLQGFCMCLGNRRFWDDSSDVNIRSARTDEDQKETAPIEIQKNSCCYWGVPGHRQLYIEYTIDKISKKSHRSIFDARGYLSNLAGLEKNQLDNVLREWCKGDLNSQNCQDSQITPISEVPELNEDQKEFVEHVEKALLAIQIIIHAEGLASIREIDEIHGWDIDYAKLKTTWPKHYRYKCAFYRKIRSAFLKNPKLENLLLDEDFAKIVREGLPSIREVITRARALLDTVETISAEMYNFSVEGFEDALEYYEDFATKRPLCARLFDTQFDTNEELMEKLDLSPLFKYQHQLRGLQSTIEKIEKNIKLLDEEYANGNDIAWLGTMKFLKCIVIRNRMENLEAGPKLVHEACMKHIETDEQMTTLHINILMRRISRAKEISKAYPPKWGGSQGSQCIRKDYDYDY